MPQKVHTMHGRDHCHNGADPIPCLPPSPAGGTYESVIQAEPSLIGYWPLNEATDSDALDRSGLGHHFENPAEFNGPPDQGSGGPFPAAPEQTSYTFSGDGAGYSGDTASDYLAQSITDLDTDTEAVTLECWLYPTDTPAITAYPLQWSSSPIATYFQFQIRPGHNMFWAVGDVYQLDSVAAINFDDWTHVVGVCSTTETQRLYFNGALIAEGTAHAVNIGDGSLYFGSAPNAIGYWNPYGGRIAQVAVYNQVLTPGQITAHYEAREGVGGADPGDVLTIDDDGNQFWAPPTGGELDPATATTWWMPLFDSDGTAVLDDDNLIPTLIPL